MPLSIWKQRLSQGYCHGCVSRLTGGNCDKKGAHRCAPFVALKTSLTYSSAFFPPRFLRAAPRISPSDAPESDEPYCATASFSSAISRALIETETLRLALSTWV